MVRQIYPWIIIQTCGHLTTRASRCNLGLEMAWLLWYLLYVYRMYFTSVILNVTSICMLDMFLYAMFLNHVLTSLNSQHVLCYFTCKSFYVHFTDRSGMTLLKNNTIQKWWGNWANVLSISSFSQFLSNHLNTGWISHLYLAGRTARMMHCHPWNVNVIEGIWQVVFLNQDIEKDKEREMNG